MQKYDTTAVMRLTDDQIQRLAERTLRRLKDDALIESKVPETEIVLAIEGTIKDHHEEGRAVENETRQLMQQYAPQINTGQVDPHRMYTMIRKQVAEKLKFELNPEEQVTQLAHKIHDRIYHDDLVDYPDEDRALRSVKQTLNETLLAEEALDEKVRTKISSLKRSVQEGSPEWDILYRQYMDEELGKKRL
jgi:hypothetical protein